MALPNNNRLGTVTKKQLAFILQFINCHEDMYRGKITPTFTKERKIALWEDLVRVLNSTASENKKNDNVRCVKSVDKWQRTWIDWKSALKRKIRSMVQKNQRVDEKLLSPIEIRAWRMFRRLDRKYKPADDSDDPDDPDECSWSDQGSAADEYGNDSNMSILIQDVRTVAKENTISVQEDTKPDLTIVKREISTDRDFSSAEETDAPVLIIKDTDPSAMDDIMSKTMKGIPRVVLKDIDTIATENVTSTEIQDSVSSGRNHLGFEAIKVLQQFVTSVRKNTTSNHMIDASSSDMNRFSAGINDAISVGAQEAASCEMNNLNCVGIEGYSSVGISNSTPGMNTPPPVKTRNSVGESSSSVKDNTSFLENATPVTQKNYSNRYLSIPTTTSEKTIWAIIDKRREALSKGLGTGHTSSNCFKVGGISTTPRMDTEERYPKQRKQEVRDEDVSFSELPPPNQGNSEGILGSLPLTLQNSILERMDALNRNIETNTCALSILSKAINDSSETQMRAINNLTLVINNCANQLLTSLNRIWSTNEG